MSNDMNESMSKYKNNEFPKLIIWYYRVIGVTFGGITFERNRLFATNQWLRFIGYISTLTYFISGIVFIYYRMLDPDYIVLYQKGLRITYYMSALILMMDIIQIVVNQLFLNVNAIPMIENVSKLGLGGKNRAFLYISFILVLVLRVIILCYSLAVEKRSTFTIVGLVLDIFYAKPAADSFLFINLTFSLSISNYYRFLRLSLNNDISSQTMAKIRKSFVKIRTLLVRFDQSMILCQIVTIFHQMLALMLGIYIISNYNKITSIAMRTHYFRNSLGSAIRLIVSCIINGMVYDEADQLFFALDTFGYNISEKTSQELLIFKTLSRDLPNGFTIGGFMPMRRTTLLTLFSFILTYAVILIQTGAQ